MRVGNGTTFTVFQIVDIGTSNAVPLRQHQRVFCAGSNLFDLLIRQLAARMCFASRAHASAFLVHISNVIRIRSDEQMCRITAGRIVAVMADEQTFWNRAISDFERDSRCARTTAIDASTAKCDEAVSSAAIACDPRPAFCWCADLHLFPEAFSPIARLWPRLHSWILPLQGAVIYG